MSLFSTFEYGKKNSDMVTREFSHTSAQSKEGMDGGQEPSCVMED